MCLGLDKWLNTALSQDLYLFQFPFNVLPSSLYLFLVQRALIDLY